MSPDEHIPAEPDAPLTPALHAPILASPETFTAHADPAAQPASPDASAARRGIAPVWHTLLLVLAITGYSFWGAQHIHAGNLDPLAPVHHSVPAHAATNEGADPMRLLRYALSGGLELLLVAWVAFGMRLRNVPFRTLFGAWPRGLNETIREAGIAALFWLSAMSALVVLALAWQLGSTAIYHLQVQHQKQSAPSTTAKPISPEKKQLQAVRELMELAPANGLEIAAWGALCLVVGFSEELVFRGYLQAQGITWLRSVPLGVIAASLVFGSAHGYQGLRGMVLISAFGAMFSIITLLRRNLFPGMLAHAWHDFGTGLLLALIRATHILDKLPLPS